MFLVDKNTIFYLVKKKILDYLKYSIYEMQFLDDMNSQLNSFSICLQKVEKNYPSSPTF